MALPSDQDHHLDFTSGQFRRCARYSPLRSVLRDRSDNQGTGISPSGKFFMLLGSET